jgi:hypothetical protein
VLKSGVASPGSVAMGIASNGRIGLGRPDRQAGLWRYYDSSNVIFDGSLALAHGPQNPGDTTVFVRFMDRNSKGQAGYRAQGDFVIDSSDYGTNAGYARATALMSTKDSIVGIRADFVFPQHADTDEVVIIRYCIYNHKATGSISDLTIGMIADADVEAALRYGQVQNGVDNVPGQNAGMNLVYQGAADTAGHVINQTPPNTATRYRGGLASSAMAGAVRPTRTCTIT